MKLVCTLFVVGTYAVDLHADFDAFAEPDKCLAETPRACLKEGLLEDLNSFQDCVEAVKAVAPTCEVVKFYLTYMTSFVRCTGQASTDEAKADDASAEQIKTDNEIVAGTAAWPPIAGVDRVDIAGDCTMGLPSSSCDGAALGVSIKGTIDQLGMCKQTSFDPVTELKQDIFSVRTTDPIAFPGGPRVFAILRRNTQCTGHSDLLNSATFLATLVADIATNTGNEPSPDTAFASYFLVALSACIYFILL